MWADESRRDAENRVYDSASELAFAAQRLRLELTRPEAARVIAPVLGCIHEAAGTLAAALRDVAVSGDASADLEACAAAIEAAAHHCERARRATACRRRSTTSTPATPGSSRS